MDIKLRLPQIPICQQHIDLIINYIKIALIMGSFPEIYLRPDLHTGHIAEASLDLLHTASQVTDRAIDDARVDFPNILNPKSLPPGMKGRWNQREKWVGRFLHMAKIIQDPWKVDLRLTEHLQRLCPLLEPTDILVFLRRAQKRINYFLTTDMPLENLGTLGLGTYAYVESRLLRKAMFDGVYLTKHY